MGSPPARLLVPEVPPPSLDLPMPRRARPVPAPGPRAAIAVVAATRTLGPLSCADALSLHRRFAILTSCALAAADVRLEQEAHRARY